MDLDKMGIEVGEYITLTDEESGHEYEYLVMYIFEIEDRVYLCLVPADQEDQEEYEVEFLRYDGTDTLQPIEDEKEWEQVEATFETLMNELDNEEV
ncbi:MULTISPECIES: DUF1292 domain-containing protein [Aneurinibacillus]|uniref:DUF1292 domain-containing protein n=1 Tax=Aneurinibacillus thermoaerophilus TaxID=143495 RepID=A0A1G7YCA7_ANETH|nr:MULTISPECIES: DUF1292 domain-containing protein [Aneurinibacillus]AMA72185.1 hypothetical protein ACH33_04495 [Aneurinibacillus sp. XH2]MED0676471.1 DUF1292 domain-containing protein [Aneurinibacillus thermoaerophilus]MED0678983.1 DUF1292 domain-containing protein [Aneurinibacillus thermoaerophilus]MED0736520.1 DUF1292 domain-containing protein [Aneurinibacillus thermoaerophilus]MED0756023.1 DUF1292 domain-containing protein [Aneurinibacillus thermoaerophilus]